MSNRRKEVERFVEKLGEDYIPQPKGTWLKEDEDWHTCHFCSDSVNKLGFDFKNDRHYLSDCRPDLVAHEIGDICTWAFRRKPLVIGAGTPGERIEAASPIEQTCYAYQDSDQKWTKEHIHFYPDGPM